MALLLALARLTRHIDPSCSPLLAPALFLTIPAGVLAMGWAWNDMMYVFFLVLALTRITSYQPDSERSRGWISMLGAGVLVGLAAWTKYTVVMMVMALALLFLIGLFRWRWRFRDLVVFAAPVGLISLLVFVKNAVFTGNPFYPFLHRLFPSPYWNDHVATFFHNALRRWEIPEWHWWTYFTFPFEITFRPRLIDTHIGILPLLLIPLAALPAVRRRLTVLKAFLLCYLVAWLVIQTETRSLLTLFAVLCCVGAYELETRLWTAGRDRRVMATLLAVSAVVSLVIVSATNYYLTQPLPYFLGRESRAEYLRREAPNQPAYEWLNSNPAVNKVLLVGAKRPFHLEKPVLFSTFSDPPKIEELSRGMADHQLLKNRLVDLGVSHVLVDWGEYEYDHETDLYSWSPEQRLVFERFIQEECTEESSFGPDFVYRITTD
jgi:hypothetical protein